MSGLIRRDRSQEVGEPTRGSGVAGRTADDFAWDGTVEEFASLGIPTPDDLGPQVATAFVTDPRVHRRPEPHRKKVAWVAGRNGVFVVELRQPLVPRPDGRFAATGGYLVHAQRMFATAA